MGFADTELISTKASTMKVMHTVAPIFPNIFLSNSFLYVVAIFLNMTKMSHNLTQSLWYLKVYLPNESTQNYLKIFQSVDVVITGRQSELKCELCIALQIRGHGYWAHLDRSGALRTVPAKAQIISIRTIKQWLALMQWRHHSVMVTRFDNLLAFLRKSKCEQNGGRKRYSSAFCPLHDAFHKLHPIFIDRENSDSGKLVLQFLLHSSANLFHSSLRFFADELQ